MRVNIFISLFLVSILFSFQACSPDENKPETPLQLFSVNIGSEELHLTNFSENTDLPFDQPILINFSAPLNEATLEEAITLDQAGTPVAVNLSLQNDDKTIMVQPQENLAHNQSFTLTISDALEGFDHEVFEGIAIEFTTVQASFGITTVVIDGQTATSGNRIINVDRNPTVVITFPVAVNTSTISNTTINFLGATIVPTLSFSFSEENKKVTITTTQTLQHLKRYLLYLSPEIEGAAGEAFNGYSKNFYTEVDPTPKLPLLPNDEDSDADNTNDLLSVVQQQTFKYFYDFAHPASGMARERNTSGNTVTSGGSGFGIMALIVGMERNFITRTQGLDRMDRILDFLETADRFHGVWPHWLDGNTGNVIPFSANDNGGDLVETSFLVQGLLTFRQYLNPGIPAENDLINRINVLWHGVEWDWYRRCEPTCQNVLYWHWSPDKGWIMNFAMYGYFEEQITYFLAAASPTHSIPKIVYSNGYGKNGAIVKNNVYEGIMLPLESPAPLFWVHYSYLGLDPHVTDDYTNYWTQNVNASLINHAYCVRNPLVYAGYSDECWGLTSSDNQSGYGAHSPANDLGVITPTAALSSFPYTPTESMKALKFFYYTMGDRLWGTYGFYDAFNPTADWYATSYLAIDQGPIIVMIENYRTGLLWDLFMSAPEVQVAMDELDFTN